MNQRAFAAAVLVATLAATLFASACGPSGPAPASVPIAPLPVDHGAPPGAPEPAAAPAPSATRTLTVRVLTHDGDAPIAKANVTVATGGDEAPGPSASAETDAEGRARVVLPADAEGPFDVTVRATGYVRCATSFEKSELPPEIVARLGPAGRVRGVVRGADGKPVEGASVFVEFDDDDAYGPEEVTTGGDGGFEIDGVALGHVFILIAKTDLGPDDRRIAMRRGLTIASSQEPLTTELTLQERPQLTVRVLWADGMPIVGAEVLAEPADPSSRRTDDSGAAVFSYLAPEQQTVFASCWGFSDARAKVDLNAGEQKTITLRPAPGPTISGVVVDEEQRPVADALVTADAEGAPTVRTRGDGAFRIACPDTTPVTLKVEAAGRENADVSDVVAPADGVRIVVRALHKVRCRLVWPAGVERSAKVAAWVDGRVTRSSVEGDVLRIDLPPGAKRVTFRAAGCVAVARDVDLSAAAVDDWGDVQLDAAPQLVVHVVDAEGRPVDAFVSPKVGDVGAPLDSTGDDGTATFDGLPAGEAVVRVEAEGYVARELHHALAVGAPPLEVTLVRGGGVRGVVLGADGKPQPKVVYVSFVDAADPKNRDRTASPSVGDDGRFECRLLPGRYRAHATLDAAEASADIEVVDGETRELTLKLSAR